MDIKKILADLEEKHPSENEYIQAVTEFYIKDVVKNMKRLFFILLLFGMPLLVFANPIDVKKGKEIAESFMNSICGENTSALRRYRNTRHEDMILVYEPGMSEKTRAEQNISEFYVFSPADSIGFVIVSGDDGVEPIVGYSQNSKFLGQDMPPALAKYLSAYSQYIRQIWDGLSEPRMQSEEEITPISPFIKTTWNQDYPYNKYCPKINGRATYTGCVATAVAQIMKYYEWPKHGHGTCTATLKDDNNTTVSTSLTHDYEWSRMIDNYKPSYTTAEANAVAQLMKDVGYACSVHYGVNGTSAYSSNAVTALLRHFDYSPEIRLVDRNYYSDKAWNDMIYQELRAGRPTYYRGADKDGNDGHAFICSGVDQSGRYYINWGWGSWCDGYFDLNALVPDGSDFNYYQEAIINIKPISEGECVEDYKPIPHVGRLEITEQNNSLVTPQVTYIIYVKNTTDRTISGQTGFAIYIDGVMASNKIKELITYNDLEPGWYWWYDERWFRWSDATDMSRGVKEIRFFWRPIDDNKWYEPFGEHSIYMLTTEEGHYFTTNKEDFGNINSVERARADKLCITPINGGIVLTSTQITQVNICTMSGMVVKELELMPAQVEICKLPRGLYIVNGQKTVVR